MVKAVPPNVSGPQQPPSAAQEEPTDEQLVDGLRAGHADVNLRALQQRYGRRIQRFVQGIVRDEWLAQDVVQEVFEKVWFKHHLYQPDTNFRAWLFEIARNQALSALRQKNRLPRPVSSLGGGHEDEPDLLDRIADPHNGRQLEEAEFMASFQQAVDELPEHYRTVFNLCVRQGRTYAEAGRELNLPTGTVAIRIMRARKRLFGELGRHMGRLRRPPACLQD